MHKNPPSTDFAIRFTWISFSWVFAINWTKDVSPYIMHSFISRGLHDKFPRRSLTESRARGLNYPYYVQHTARALHNNKARGNFFASPVRPLFMIIGPDGEGKKLAQSSL